MVVVVAGTVVVVVDSLTGSTAWVVDEAAVWDGSAQPATSNASAIKTSLTDPDLTTALSNYSRPT
jgi:hypothetical protein